mgnify:CR=1 FL=1
MATYQAVNLGADATLVGIIGATFALAPLLLAIQVGKWVDFGFAGRATFLGPIITLVSTIGLVFADQLWLFVPTQQEVGKWLMTFREFPPRQATASFTIDTMMSQMQQMLQMRARAGQMGGAGAPGQ